MVPRPQNPTTVSFQPLVLANQYNTSLRGRGACLIFFPHGPIHAILAFFYVHVFPIDSAGCALAVLSFSLNHHHPKAEDYKSIFPPPCHAMNFNADLRLNVTVVNEDRLSCCYADPPIYVPALKAMILVGQFVFLGAPEERSDVVCQIIGCVEGHDNLIEILLFSPLYSSEANE
jgi:hypothetical protein